MLNSAQNRTSGRFCGILIKISLDGGQALRFWGARLWATDVANGSVDLDKGSKQQGCIQQKH